MGGGEGEGGGGWLVLFAGGRRDMHLHTWMYNDIHCIVLLPPYLLTSLATRFMIESTLSRVPSEELCNLIQVMLLNLLTAGL
jgi:hypothetical protein